MDFNSISKSLQDAIVNVTSAHVATIKENNIVGVIDGVRSDRKYNDADHAHNSLSKLVAYQKAKKAELYVNGEKTKHYELNKRYDDFEPKKLAEEQISEEMGNRDSAHFAQQSQKMQDAINLHLRRGKNYQQAVAAARVHVKEDLDESAIKDGKLQGHMVNFKPKGNLSGDEVVKKVNDIAKSLQTNHPDKVHKGAYSHGFGDYSFSEKHRGPKSGYVVVKSKEHLDAVKQHIKSHGASIQESVEQIDELSKKTLTSYVNKSTSDYGGSQFASRVVKNPDQKAAWSKRAFNRAKGLERAVPRLVGEGEQMEEATVHPMGLHVKPVKVGGKTKYHVHAVGKELGNGIKVGEHLSDTELDDASEMGAKIKHLKEDQMVDKTIELHDDFIVDLPTELGYRDYLNAAQSYSEDPSEAIMIADSFFKSRDESLVIENFMRSDIESKIKAHEKAGSKVNDTKYSTKNGKPYAEYTVTDSDGRKSRYIHHGTTRRVERE